ncbi:GNAT family N-acetyltransferase [Microcoleus sp. FACHB-672]|uniref:GNAT family N-acetyltransferase n=1 Tax=Microcoleus sp. FACHB-672 TaxID=2692825 RepID=UPI0016875654|nr:GNAT family N-acetyltransferase [Microcoleus sp. FACHB-672]MBD2043149.1 GNAT family N-acetyltransferase [Microcoleus sp. FACHB-672]
MNIREAQLEDIKTLFNIRTSVIENYQSLEELASLGVTPETIASMLQTECRAWIAEIDAIPIAFSMANAAEKTIFAMFVLPSFEGRGAGRALMQEAEQWLWHQGVEEIWLLTGNDPNLRAYGFYIHLGWIPVELQPDGQVKFIKRRVIETETLMTS